MDCGMKVLIIEDDADTAAFVVKGLERSGCAVDHAVTGRDGLFLASDGGYDAIVVDRLLPGMDGLNLVRVLRSSGVTTPILFLTAVGGLNDRVEGLDAGGDDYLVKPFAFAELMSRLRALTRRPPLSAAPTVLEIGDLKLDRLARTVQRAGVAIELQPREFNILDLLAQHVDQIVTRTMLYERIWDYHFEPKSSVVETHLSRLRAKIDKPFDVELIKTVRGVGYILASPK